MVIYSVVARSSFRVAEEIVNYLWRENVTKEKAVILTANKADLARSRVIPTSGILIINKQLLKNCKNIFYLFFKRGKEFSCCQRC